MSMTELIALLAVILPPLIGLVGAIAIPVGRALMARMLDAVPSAKRADAEALVAAVVAAVGQQFEGAAGAAKKQEATRLVQQLAAERKIALSAADINVLIEAAVAGLKQSPPLVVSYPAPAVPR